MGRVLIVVGIGPGVGAAVARRFAREGYAVGAVARSAAGLAAQLEPLRAAGTVVEGVTADAGDPAALQAAIALLQQRLGPAEVLVYNAAGVRMTPLATLAAAELAEDLAISVVGALAAAQAVLPGMRERGAGSVLLTGGGYAFEPAPALASLGVGKAALRNLAFSLHADLQPAGVHAATVTIAGPVQPGTAFDPDRIAEAYWALHQQPRGAFDRETIFRA